MPTDAEITHRIQQVQADGAIWERPASLMRDALTEAVVLSFDPSSEDEADALRPRVERLRLDADLRDLNKAAWKFEDAVNQFSLMKVSADEKERGHAAGKVYDRQSDFRRQIDKIAGKL